MSNLDRLNHFVKNPVNLSMSRSKFKRPFTHKTTFKSGDLVPIFLDEVLPGDTFSLDFSSVIRMLTPAVPVMDNAFLDVYFFYVPNRLCTLHPDDWAKICGENTAGYWAPATETTLENSGNVFSLRSVNLEKGSVASYFGLPIGDYRVSNAGEVAYLDKALCSVMPFIAYCKIWNEFFRDQNTQAPVSYASAGSYIANFSSADSCLKVNKLHDYFCSVLPAPQKGDSVLLPIAGSAPVITSSSQVVGGTHAALAFTKTNGSAGDYSAYSLIAQSDKLYGLNGNTTGTTFGGLYPNNLYADLQNATAVSVNEMRQAFAIQRMLEKDARGGTRYREMLKAHFGVTIPDLTVQVPEYLTGKRIPLNVTQVLQTSETSTTPLGTTGAFSNTGYTGKMFTKSFSEFGFVVGVACVRTEQSYSQGLAKMWTRNRRYDWYYPVFANLGEQPVYKRELFLKQKNSGAVAADYTEVFGYQEAWADYRFHPNLVTGALAPNAGMTNFTAWTYTTSFSSAPTLNSSFMKQPKEQIGDTLVVTNTAEQFVADMYFDLTCTRVMPLYSIPGLIDHH